ncbi:peptidase A4 family-domain-containing protein [Boletus edulis]|nr:peptidase A4 family-domain-containing protein [Boletus edulis]
MRLNCALVSSILFVSAVLADFHSEKQLEPMFLQRAKKPINGTPHVRAPASYGVWAGGVVERNNGTITLATGTFVVPHPQGAPGSGFVIGVGIDGLTCTTAALAAGVNVMITDHGVNVIPWGELWPRIIKWNPDPPSNDLIVSTGDQLRVTVEMTFSSIDGSFLIENLTTGKNWSDPLKNNPDSPLCQRNAFWVIAVVPDGKTPLANFGTTTFTNISMKAPGNYVFAGNPVVINSIEQNKTSVQVQPSSDITITYG